MISIKGSRRSHRLVIALEGIDGAGKTTLTNAIKRQFGDNVGILPRTKKGKGCEALINSKLVYNNHCLQIPIYLFLSYVNYFKNLRSIETPITIMDRCFLSNICYYYPVAMKNRMFLWLALLFEIKIFPDQIFIIDEEPSTAHQRDGYQKELDWLISTRNNYLQSAESELLKKYNITIVPKELSVESKASIIIEAIISQWRRKNDS